MRIVYVIGLLLLGTPVFAANGCEDIWFTRNLIMDRAGYCFSSPLGRAMFDNSDCLGTQVQPHPAYQPVIGRIRSLEAQHGCQVNTNRTWLDMDDIAFRRALRDLPVYAEGEWGCIGWTGPVAPLYDGHSEPFHAIGQIQPGDYVYFGYEAPPNWAYVRIYSPGSDTFKSAGWLYWTVRMPCAQEAG